MKSCLLNLLRVSHYFLGALIVLSTTAPSKAQFAYIYPKPGSKMHNKEVGIILRTGDTVNAASLNPDIFSLKGSSSGDHIVKVKLAPDKKSILVRPVEMFSYGETVTVTVTDGIRNIDGKLVKGTGFWFQIREKFELDYRSVGTEDEYESTVESKETRSVCEQIPEFVINSTPGAFYNEPLFYWNHSASPSLSDCWRKTIISSDGDSLYSVADDDVGFDFLVNENGYLTCYNKNDSCFDVMDSAYQVVKKCSMKNGYNPNKHEFRIYANGYHFMQCYDRQIMDLTAYGGKPDALVTGLVLQEIDPDDNVIFEWRSWDYFKITDAADDILLTESTVDYVHCNSIELDFDGNLLISSRHLDEITKIDLSTGEIMWRMGGKNNQFTFINDPDTPKPFSHQHHFRRLPNGHYTMFDNGNYQIPERSAPKEFVLDQVNKTATLVWTYVHPQVNGYNVFGSALGNLQLLLNGNRLINWGQIANGTAVNGIPNFTEIDSNGNIVWEFRFADSTYVAYRAEKHPWDRCNLIADSSISSDNITTISADLHWNDHSKFSGFILEYRKCTSSSWLSVPLSANSYHLDGLEPNTCYDFRIMSICTMYDDSFYTLIHQFTTLNTVSSFMPDNGSFSISIHPNPASGNVEVSIASQLMGTAELCIYSSLGLKVRTEEIAVRKDMNKLLLDIESFTPGIYIVEIRHGQATVRKPLVVQ